MNINSFLNYLTNVKLNNFTDNKKNYLNKAFYFNIFKKNGYVVIKNFLDKRDIDLAKTFYKKLIIKNNDVAVFRQNTGLVEKNYLTNKNYLLNPIQNIQDLDEKKFEPYIDQVKKITMSSKIKKMVSFFLKSEPILIQTMQFEIDPCTPPHQDSYYMNSRFNDGMIGVWFALEDIKKEAGRFFLINKSHQKYKSNYKNLEITTNHKKYLNRMKQIVIQDHKKISAPYLNKGDIIIWNSNTIHGSAGVLNRNYSRFSLTAHYIKNDDFYFKGFNKCKIKKEKYKNFFYSKNKDNKKLTIKTFMKISLYFPNIYKKAKNIVRSLTR